jgi:hypothetical protein
VWASWQCSKAGLVGVLWVWGVGTLLCLITLLFSLKYGTRNITKFDTFLLIAALFTIIYWLTIKDPLWAVVLVSIIDLIAFIPTYRKTYQEPHTETLSSYILDVISNLFAIIAIASYSIASTLYISSLVFTNFVLVLIIIFRRKK